ncbi:hypothetical protein OOK36_49475 [Streptomyces sp. NBC_00365]|uniref:hypothetical protein n=1 Tax=Streptomyces sp. NBC_00365 TaxID=2975726 RepID=UPI0022586131|nr:hypothetical protein [Streptomyces sp. NBC_00365]MCX5096616.1 hypothetical protein [Streptomyces sp. NBC_00365]
MYRSAGTVEEGSTGGFDVAIRVHRQDVVAGELLVLGGQGRAGRHQVRHADLLKKSAAVPITAADETLGLPVMITVTPADVQDRDAARDVFWRLRLTQPQITQVGADRGYAGELVDSARERVWLTLRIVFRPEGVKGFVVLPRRWKPEQPSSQPLEDRRPIGGLVDPRCRARAQPDGVTEDHTPNHCSAP